MLNDLILLETNENGSFYTDSTELAKWQETITPENIGTIVLEEGDRRKEWLRQLFPEKYPS